MASIPDRFIRDKRVDFEGEILSCYGVGVETHGINLPPLTLGVMSLLELLDNKLFKGEEATWFDFGVVFYLLHKKEKALKKVSEYVRGYKRPLENAVRFFIFRKRLSLLSMPKVKELIENAFTGFDMLPRSGGDSGLFLYGAETISSMAYIACGKLNKSYEDLMWNTPLTLIGHISAVNAIQSGVNGVGRRKDEDHLKYLFKCCKEWDKQEKLYPWQWLEPDIYKLEAYQDSRNIKRDYDKRLKEVKNA